LLLRYCITIANRGIAISQKKLWLTPAAVV
jgi:hypothetical protein